MKKYFKNIEGEYLTAISTGTGMEEITQEEYEHILSVIRSAPVAEEGYQYHLKTDLTWELAELPAPEADPEIGASEALDIIIGGDE